MGFSLQSPKMPGFVLTPNCSSRIGIVSLRQMQFIHAIKQLNSSSVSSYFVGSELHSGLFKKSGARKSMIIRFEKSQAAGYELQNESVPDVSVEDRVPFDLDLAVLLAGFAFESYNTPPADKGTHEYDAGDCETIYLSTQFLREVYQGQLTVKLKKGIHFPAMDLWGLSDPYVILRIGDCIAKSRTIWASLDPVWNETFTLNVVAPKEHLLQIAAWDANVVSSHRRMGNIGISLDPLSDGKWHELELELEGMGGGGKIFLEVRYRTFAEIDAEKWSWEVPFLSQFLRGTGLESALKSFVGADGIQASDFVRSALGYFDNSSSPISGKVKQNGTTSLEVDKEDEKPTLPEADSHKNKIPGLKASETLSQDGSSNALPNGESTLDEKKSVAISNGSMQGDDKSNISKPTADDGKEQPPNHSDYLNVLTSTINRTLEAFSLDNIDFHIFGGSKQNDHDMLLNHGTEAQMKAEESFIDTGLAFPNAAPETENIVHVMDSNILPSVFSKDEVKRASQNILSTMEEVLGSWLMLSKLDNGSDPVKGESDDSKTISTTKKPEEDAAQTAEESASFKETEEINKREEMRQMFKRAESAMEAWAMLASYLGCTSFVKSEFEKVCFLENKGTDTQVAIWRDLRRHRLVVAFRGTEQTRWKDLKTDLMLVPTGFNPERVGGGNFKTEAMVHSGFLNAYDSVKSRILSIIKASTRDVDETDLTTWKIYITGHSLGGALATLLALELSWTKLSKQKYISITMYNFGSPRVGNKIFAESYNQVMKDSWRVVNHRDIIPTVPRMMGYCHVAQPIYLSTEKLFGGDSSWSEDGYNGDVIGESTPDLLLHEFMKGEKQLLERLLQTEITMLKALRDGSALMQHMEDFYYVSLLEQVSSKYKSATKALTS